MNAIFLTTCIFLIVSGLGLLIAAVSHQWMDWTSYVSATAGTAANTAGWMLKGAMR